jgi:methylmalonyl-CoA carboxyltransferase small subunit
LKLQVTVEGKTYEVEVEILEEDAGTESTIHPAYPPPAPAQPALTASEFRNSESWGEAEDEKVCRSPIAGLVVRVNVEPGQSVEANDVLMVLEAMKMENSVTAPASSTVKSVLVAPGDSVRAGQVLVEFE